MSRFADHCMGRLAVDSQAFASLRKVPLLLQSQGMDERRQLAGRRPLVRFVAFLFVVGCGSGLTGGTGGSGGAGGASGAGGSSACPQNAYPTTTVCCAGFATDTPTTQSYLC